MGRYRKIDPRMWGDQKFRELSKPQPNAQSLWQYLLTGPHTNSCPGLYEVGELELAEKLGWPLKGFREVFQELLQKGMVKADFSAHVIYIPKVKEYDRPQSVNVVKKWAKDYDEVPECDLKTEYYYDIRAFIEGFGEGFKEAFVKAFRKPFGKPSGMDFLPEPEPKPYPEPKPKPKDKTSLSPTKTLVDLFNSTVEYLPKITDIGKTRTDKIKTRFKEGKTSLSWWKTVFEKADLVLIPSKNGGRDWFPTFDWLIDNDKNAVKVFEGNYDHAKRPTPPKYLKGLEEIYEEVKSDEKRMPLLDGPAANRVS